MLRSDVPRTATVTAIRKSIILGLSKESYRKLKYPWMEYPKKLLEQVAANRLHDVVAKVPFLSNLPPLRLNALGELFSYKVVPANEIIFYEGQEGDTFYVCIEGELNISVKGECYEINNNSIVTRNILLLLL